MGIEVRPSPIHGLGVFATRTFSKGEWIGRYAARKTDRDGTYVLWVYDEDRKLVSGYDGYGRLRYLNHHSQPNGEMDGLDLYALRTIRPGAEITIHHGDEWADSDDLGQPAAG